MRFLNILVKAVIISVLFIVVFLAAIAVYMKFQGRELMAYSLSRLLGTEVAFEGISMNLEDYTLDFKGFTVQAAIDFTDADIFRAERFVLALDRERLSDEGEVIIEHVLIEKALLNIVRARDGRFNLSGRIDAQAERGLAYADTAAGPVNVYDFAKNVRVVEIRDSVIYLEDRCVEGGRS